MFCGACCVLLSLLLVLGSLPLVADNASVDAIQVTLPQGSTVLPQAPDLIGDRVFCGWRVGDLLLPAGASYTATDEIVITSVSVKMATGANASVRLQDGDVGLRFTSFIAYQDHAALVRLVGAEHVQYGTYITTDTCLKKASAFTAEAMDAAGCPYLDVSAPNFYQTKDTDLIWAGSVAHILPGNYTRNYAARGYMILTYSDGSTARVLCPFSMGKQVQNIYSTVFAAYEDRQFLYPHLVIDEKGHSSHSNYTLAELGQMADFLDKAVSVKFRNKTAAEKKIDPSDCLHYYAQCGSYYKSPWLVAYQQDKNSQLVTITVTAPEGHSLSEVKGVAIGGSYKSYAEITQTEDTFVFTFEEYSPVY